MISQAKYAVPPTETSGFRVFVRTAYPARYNFAVENYNSVSVKHKATMRGGRLLLFRSIVAVVWIISMVFALLALLKSAFVIGTCLFSFLYIALSIYNLYVFFDNRDLLNSRRLLRAKIAGPNGLDYEWVSVPLDSRSANERLAAVDQLALDNVRKEYAGSSTSEIDCMVYTKRYADTYPTFPKELLLHLVAFFVAIIIGIILASL
jgi:hypothetical protein